MIKILSWKHLTICQNTNCVGKFRHIHSLLLSQFEILLKLRGSLNPILHGINSSIQQKAHPQMKMSSHKDYSKAPLFLP